VNTLSRYLTLSLALAAALALCCVSGFSATRGPDAAGYTATDQVAFSFVDISAGGAGTSLLAGIDDGAAPLTIPFAFQFYGQNYSTICVSSNGALYFVSAAAGCGAQVDFANTDLNVAAPPGDLPALLPLWSDLTFQVPGAGAVFYQTLGSSGSRRFVVQWNNAYPQGSLSPVTFQAVLYEGSNRVLFQYASVLLDGGNPLSGGAGATVGIHNAGGLAKSQQIQWSFDAGVLADNTAIQFAPAAATTGAPNLIATARLARQPDGSYVATVTVTNKGSGPALNVQLTSAALGSATGAAQPQALGEIDPGQAATATVAFPASAGKPGASVIERYSGTFTGATFSASLRAALP
jgi:hypothetical protein